MGKKSKQHKSTKVSQCYHSCTKKEFNNYGEFYKVLEGWVNKAVTVDDNEFYETHEHVLVNPIFSRFVIAHIADDYLKGKDSHVRHRLYLLVDMRYRLIPEHEGKDVGPESEYTKNCNKYMRDIMTERGRINCMAREIPCDCMEAKRIEAQAMEKVAMCYFCLEDFPKEKMLRCKGCNYNQYCSKKCSIDAWPAHREGCQKNSVSSVPTPIPTPASVPSFGGTIDVEEEKV